MNKRFTGCMSKTVAALLALTLVTPIGVRKASAKVYSENIYEAENAVKHNVNVGGDHSGYTGSGFVDSYGEQGDYVEFTVDVPSDGDYTLRTKYANNTGNTVVRQVYVDGQFISNAYYKNLSNWDSWGTSDVGTNLKKGTHKIKFAVDNGSDGFINLDNLVVTPKNVSVPSLYMSNWNNMMAVWKNSKLSPNDTTGTKGPRLDELRFSGNWDQNQIKDYSSFFRDETNGKKLNDAHQFDSEAYFDEYGILHNNYTKYNGSYVNNVDISKDYAMIPYKNFMVVKYSFKNNSNSSLNYNVLDMLHPNNTSDRNLSSYYDSSRNAVVVNMSNSGQPYLALGAFDSSASHQCANDEDTNNGSSTVSPWISFDKDGSLKNNNNVNAKDISVGFSQKVDIPANATKDVYFYVTLCTSENDIHNVCNEIRTKSGSDWFDYTKSQYTNWFNGKKIPTLADQDLVSVYKRNLVMIKNSLRPGTSTQDGAMPATTNPLNYSSKVWSRDSAVTAMSLDQAKFSTEAERYWRWLAARQEEDGSFHTCYWLWSNTNANFVEPEYDSLGMFLMGVYNHYKLTGDKAFLNDMYPAVKKTANFIMNNMDQTTGFGPADKSIFEEGDYNEYYTYTQTAYAMGLKAAAKLAEAKGDTKVIDNYNGAGSTIITAIQRDDTDAVKGLYNVKNGYYNRTITTDNKANNLEDTSTNILFAFGAVDANSSRAASHVNKLEKDLMKDGYGLPRYANDTFYNTSQWSPCGDEALEASPSWPQMTMWDSIYQSYIGNKSKAYDMLEWFKHRTGTGYMVTGECASNVTEAPCISTACEPVTAAAYVLACLAYNGDDFRIYASENNAGAHKTLNVTNGASKDWSQYKYVPYYVDETGETKDSRTDIKKVYIANDDKNIYVRINNAAGNLNGFNSNSKFKTSVYCENFGKTTGTTQKTIDGTAMGRNMAYAFTRTSSEDSYDKYTVSGSNWTKSGSVSGVIAPQWDTSTGGIEMVIPRSEIGNPADDSWGHIDVVLSQNSNNSWSDQDVVKLNYRLTSGNESWMLGDFE